MFHEVIFNVSNISILKDFNFNFNTIHVALKYFLMQNNLNIIFKY